MSTVVTLDVSPGAFSLGRALESADRSVTAEVEPVVPHGGQLMPFVRVHGTDVSSVTETLERHDAVGSVTLVQSDGDECLYRVDLTAGDDVFITELRDANASILAASGSADRWRFRLRFPRQSALTRFHERCIDADVAFSVHRVDADGTGAGRAVLTPEQREALYTALEAGYFEIPRRSTLSELAETLGISDQAMSERLRRGAESLLYEAL